MEHISSVHKRKYTRPCTICYRKFSSRTNLKRHSKIIHEHQCNGCDKKFINDFHLMKHFSKFHSPQDDEQKNPLQCKSCGRNFSSQCNLKRHSAIKHEHQCNSCDKSFIFENSDYSRQICHVVMLFNLFNSKVQCAQK